MRRSRRAWQAGMVVAAALGIGLLGALTAQADTPDILDITVRGDIGGETDTIDLESMTYDDAVAAFGDAADDSEPSATLPVAPGAFLGVTASDAEVHYGEGDQDEFSIAIRGDTNLLGLPAEMLVTAVWDDADTDDAPETAVLFSFGGGSLGDFSAFDDFPLSLTDSWIAISRHEHTVDPDGLPDDVADFFDDGLDATDDTFDVVPIGMTGGGVSFRGVLDATDTVIGDAANQIGLSGEARIDGVLSGSIAALDSEADEATASAGLSLTATFPTTDTGTLPDWFDPGPVWTLTIAADSGGNIEVGLGGSADITIDEVVYPVEAEVGFAYDGTDATFSLSATLGTVDNMFGVEWIDLTELTVDASFSTADGFNGGLEATMDIEDLTGDVGATATIALEVSAGSGGASGSLTLTASNIDVTLAELATALGAPSPPSGLSAGLTGFSLFVGFESGDPSASVTVAVRADVNIGINDATIDSDVLFRLTVGGGQPAKFLFGIRPDENAPDVTVGQLLGADFGSGDVTLPRFTLTISNHDWDIAADDLDDPTASYIGDNEDLDVGTGVDIIAEVVIPQALRDALGQIGLDTEGDLVLTGHLPLFGSTELSIEIAFPTIVGASGQPFKEGTLSLVFKREGTPPVFKMGIEGTATISVPRTEDPDCSAADNYAGACTDELVFDLSATLSLGAGSVAFDLMGGLTVEDGWEEPFGINGLEIFELRLKVGIQIGGDSPTPSAKIGMLGRLSINGKDLTLSFLLRVTPTPPFVEPLGFTFATKAGFGIQDLVTLHETVSGEDVGDLGFPTDLRVEDVFVAFGRVSDPDLCIRPGFFLTAELHLGGTAPSGETPGCDAPPVDPPQVTQGCEDSDSCLAAILLDIDTGVASGTPSFKAAGYFAATDLGPLHFDPVRIELELSASKQRLFISGGASLDDPFDTTDPAEWASGSFMLDFTPTQLKFVAELNLADGEFLHVKATGVAALSLSNPDFDIDLEFRSDILDDLANEIATGVNNLVSDVEDFFDSLGDARSDSPNIWRNLLIVLQKDGTAPQWVIDVVNTFAQVEDTIGGVNQAFIDVGLPPPVLSKALIDIVLHGITIPGFGGIPGVTIGSFCLIPNIFTGGCAVTVPIEPPTCLGFTVNGSCYTVPPFGETKIPGLCDVPGFAGDFHAILCTDLSEEAIVGELFLDEIGLDPPDHLSGTELLDALKPKFTSPGVDATCGYAKVDYGDHTISDTELTMNVHGTVVVFDTPLDLVGGTFDPTNSTTQEVLEALLNTGDATPGRCTTSSVAAPTPVSTITLGVTPTVLDEGQTVTATGDADVQGATSVNIDWGDGSPDSSAPIAAGGAYTANHTYADDVGPGQASTYTVTATAGTVADTERVTVRNVAPTADASFSPAAIDEAGTATLNVAITDPGADTHVVEAKWADGVIQTANLSGGARSHAFTRVIADDNPSATAQDVLGATVTVRDDDGGTAVDTASVTVRNVAPSTITLTPVDVLTGPEVFDQDNNLIVKEGQVVLWQVTFNDVGKNDLATVGINWGDGSSSSRVVPGNGTNATRTFQIEHLYADDNPTATASDDYSVSLTVTDDDTGSASTTKTVKIHDAAPVITSVTSTDNAPSEQESVSLTINFDDLGLLDTASVVVDWKDGSTNTYPVAVPSPRSIGRTVVATHTYADENPTATSHDNYPVAITVTDDDTLSASTTKNLDVTNVRPVIDSLVVSHTSHNENATDVSLDLAFSDVSVMDSHSVTIDWGNGWTSGNSADTAVEDEDKRRTVVSLAAPGASATPAQVTNMRKVHATNRYGDNGTYTIGVTLVDDDTGQATGSWNLTVVSVNPTHAINDAGANGATTTAGGQTFIAGAGQDVTITDTANDPGSDDLAFDWSFGDGATDLNSYLVGMPTSGIADVLPSPQVSARVNVTDSVTHSWSSACLYGVSVAVTDDDNGSGGTDYVAVIVQRVRAAGDTAQRNHGQWRDAIDLGVFTTSELTCYLDIAGHLSSVLFGPSEKAGRPWAPKVGTEDLTRLDADGVPLVLTRQPGKGASKLVQEQIKLDRSLLSGWLNFADGAWQWGTLIEDSNGDGILDTSFATVLTQVEAVRRTSNSDKAVADARQRLWRLGIV